MTHYAGRFAGKRAIVTGAASGIGRAAATRLAKEGARVGLIDRAKAQLDEVAALIKGEGGEALAWPADVSDEGQISAAIDAAAAQWGGLDIVISNAGIEPASEDTRVDALPIEVWNKVLGTNLTGQFLTCKHGVSHLLESGGGAVVMTGSPCGLRGFCFKEHAYSSSKGGILSLMQVMALDYAPHHIRVNAVVPGFIDTPMNAHVMGDPEQLEYWSEPIPLKRPGKPEEVAAIILFLASDEASYVTGSAYRVDGGQLA
jgi:NAD(P)-dependent dehydrogenase (short-subunit alcohol dehydrogenase family)